MEISSEHFPTLLAWLHQAAVRIEVTPIEEFLDGERYAVRVHNGEGGDASAGCVVAICGTSPEAELVAAGLWALLRQVPPIEKADETPDFALNSLPDSFREVLRNDRKDWTSDEVE